MVVWCRPTRRRAPKPSAKGTGSASSSSAECHVRSYTTTPSWRWRASSVMANANAPGSSVNCNRTICSAIASGGQVEGLVGYARRNFMVPIPHALDFAELNARLLECCGRRWGDRLRGHDETIGERLVRDRGALLPLPPTPYDACEKM